VAARALELTLTSRSKDTDGVGIPMCGVPFHAMDTYLTRLVREGVSRRDLRAGRGPEKAKGSSGREVRVVSPVRSPTRATSRPGSRRF
jgi:DNA mismatch repair protein MutS